MKVLWGNIFSINADKLSIIGPKFSDHFEEIIKKRQSKMTEKQHLGEMIIRINSEYFILWRDIDSEGYKVDVFLQKRRNKKSAIRFLSRLLRSISHLE